MSLSEKPRVHVYNEPRITIDIPQRHAAVIIRALKEHALRIHNEPDEEERKRALENSTCFTVAVAIEQALAESSK